MRRQNPRVALALRTPAGQSQWRMRSGAWGVWVYIEQRTENKETMGEDGRDAGDSGQFLGLLLYRLEPVGSINGSVGNVTK